MKDKAAKEDDLLQTMLEALARWRAYRNASGSTAGYGIAVLIDRSSYGKGVDPGITHQFVAVSEHRMLYTNIVASSSDAAWVMYMMITGRVNEILSRFHFEQ